MTRTIVALVVGIVLVYAVLSFTGQRSSAAKERIIALIESKDFSADQNAYLMGLVDQFDMSVARDTVDPSDGEVNTTEYVQRMCDRFMAAAREDGKSGAFIEKLGDMRASGGTVGAGG